MSWNPYFDPTLQDNPYAGQYNQNLRRGNTGYVGQYNQGLNRTDVNTPMPDFNLSGNAPLNAQQIGSIATGALGLGLNAYNAANQHLNLNQQIAPSQYDQYSRPTYTAGAAQSEAANARINGVNGGEVLGGVAQGAAAGSAIAPGIGTAIGAGVGAVTSIIGGALRGKAQERERARAMQRVRVAQQQYNQQDVNFRNQQNQYNEYLQRTNPYAREYNVYKTRFSY